MPTVSFSGIASGIDGDAIIKAMIDSQRLANIPMQNRVQDNDTETAALTELKSKLSALGSTIQDFSSLVGGAVTKTAVTSNNDALTATATNAAVSSSTTVQIFSLAKAATLSFDDRFANSNQPIAPNLQGTSTITFTVGTGDSASTISVNVDAQTTLASLANSITEAGQGKVISSVVNTGTAANPQYLLLVHGTETGTVDGNMSVAVGSGLTDAGLFSSFQVDQAVDARLSVSGIGEVTRPTNKVSDLIPGVTLNLQQAGSGPIQLSVRQDAEATAGKFADIIAMFNDIVAYSRDNGQITRVENSDGTVTNQWGSLAHTDTDNQAVDGIRRALSESISGIQSSSVRIFADLGVTTQQDGTLKFDQQKFLDAMGKDPTSAGQILTKFADKVGGTAGVISTFVGFSRAFDLAIRANESANSSINQRLAQIEENLNQQTLNLKKMFANLESTIGGLNAESQNLNSMLAGLASSAAK